MKLTADQVKNLCLLADFMEGLDDPKFTMLTVRHPCGAPACAFGWAQTIPKFIAAGIRDTCSWDRKFFGVGDELFRGSLHESIKTPQQWAAHCRAFLKENGYEVTKSDGFEKFMKKVTEPVDTEEFHPWRTA